MTDIKISDNINDFFTVYEDMKQQFPENELKPQEHFVNLFKKEVYKLFLCKYGYMLFARDKETNTLWLDYFAVYKQFHSQGKGSEIMKSFIDCNSDYTGCYIELEQPDKKQPDTIRRIKFYEKFGAYNLNLEYYFPSKEAPLPMELFFIPFHNKKPEQHTVMLSVKNIFHLLHSDVINLDDFLRRIAYRVQSPQEEQ